MNLLTRLIALCAAVGLLVASGPSRAQDLGGDWVWTVEGRNMLVLSLDADAAGDVSGVLKRPERFSMTVSAGRLAVVGATLPVVERQVTTLAREGASRRILVVDPAAPEADTRREYWLRPSDGGAELIATDNADAPAIPLTRPRPVLEVAADLDPQRTYADRPSPPSDPELAAMFEADQSARQAGFDIDWSVVGVQDAERRERLRAMMAEGRLKSADDYWRAAFIFQHGDKPDDYLLAHSLAVVSAGLGKGEATWIAAATLDRYLQSIDRPQIYGTQFSWAPGEPVGQGDYDRELISDAVRLATGVPSQADQAERARQMQAQRDAPQP